MSAKCKFCGYKDPAGDQGQKCPNCDEENAFIPVDQVAECEKPVIELWDMSDGILGVS